MIHNMVNDCRPFFLSYQRPLVMVLRFLFFVFHAIVLLLPLFFPHQLLFCNPCFQTRSVIHSCIPMRLKARHFVRLSAGIAVRCVVSSLVKITNQGDLAVARYTKSVYILLVTHGDVQQDSFSSVNSSSLHHFML